MVYGLLPDQVTPLPPDDFAQGEGIFDLSRYLHVLQQIGYDRFLSLELFRQDLWYRDPVEVAAEGMAKMQKVVAG